MQLPTLVSRGPSGRHLAHGWPLLPSEYLAGLQLTWSGARSRWAEDGAEAEECMQKAEMAPGSDPAAGVPLGPESSAQAQGYLGLGRGCTGAAAGLGPLRMGTSQPRSLPEESRTHT